MHSRPTLLLTVTGPDRPGVTSALFTALAPLDVEVLDVEQVVLRQRLVLGVQLRAGGSLEQVRDVAEKVVSDLGLDLETSVHATPDGRVRRGARHHVTVLGRPVSAAAFAGIARRVTGCDANIDRIVRLSSYPVTSFELIVSGADSAVLRSALADAAAEQHVDVAVERAGLHRRAKRLVVMDVDSTLIRGEVIEMLAARAGCAEQVAGVTASAMAGDLDFEQSLRTRVALLEGLPYDAVERVRDSIQLAPGARTLVRTLKQLGYRLAVVSGGFTEVTDALVRRLGVDYAAANTLEVVDGRLTGRLVGPILDRAGKAAALERFAEAAGVPVSQTVAVGDGANDIDMLTRAGLGIAFNAKPAVRQAADAAVNVPYLDAILFLLGISRDEVEDADEQTPVGVPRAGSPPMDR
ncbi:MAG TPA: phosphoserine phosphatase SerB [Mycobacteriales bacterium]|nr:phosphoserine phosphatase SerB [Mycobacteriales bacterium]